MVGSLELPIVGFTGSDKAGARRALDSLFLAAWTVHVRGIVDGSRLMDSKMCTADELVEMRRLIAEMQAKAPNISELYDILGAEAGSDAKALTGAYRARARALHPDKNPGDISATARFQRLNEAYEVLSDPNRRIEYEKAHAPNTHIPNVPLPDDLLEAEFGAAKALEPVVGQLFLSCPLDSDAASPRGPGDAAMRAQHVARATRLRLRLESELCMWLAGDKAGVLQRVHERASAAARSLGGAHLLLAVGRAYMDKANMVLGGFGALSAATAYFVRRGWGYATSAGPCWSVLRNFGEVSTRLSVLQAKAATDEKAQRAMLRLVREVVLMIRKMCICEVDQVLDEVLEDVLVLKRRKRVGLALDDEDNDPRRIRLRAQGVREIGRIFINAAREKIESEKGKNQQSKT